ncbi:unnamed protein product, partial [Gadus morhua 'NCC']
GAVSEYDGCPKDNASFVCNKERSSARAAPRTQKCSGSHATRSAISLPGSLTAKDSYDNAKLACPAGVQRVLASLTSPKEVDFVLKELQIMSVLVE